MTTLSFSLEIVHLGVSSDIAILARDTIRVSSEKVSGYDTISMNRFASSIFFLKYDVCPPESQDLIRQTRLTLKCRSNLR